MCPLYSLAGTDERTEQIREAFPAPEQARDAALSKLTRLQREEKTFEFTLASDRADVHLETLTTAAGFKAEINATAWVISDVEHLVDGRAYTNSLSLEAGGLS